MYKRYSIISVKNAQDEILMGRRRDNDKYTNPGGGCHKGECPTEAAVREFKEETGVALESLVLCKTFFTENKNLIYMFEGFLPKEYEFDTSKDPDLEVELWEFVDPFDVIDILHVPADSNVILKEWAKN